MSNCFESKCLRRTLGIKTEQIYRKCWDLSGPSSTLGLKKKVRKREGNENDLSQGREAVGQHSRESKESLCWGLMGAEKVQIYQHRDRFRTEWDNGYCWGLLGGWDTFQTPGHLQKCHFSNLQRIDVIFFFFVWRDFFQQKQEVTASLQPILSTLQQGKGWSVRGRSSSRWLS